MHQGPNPSQRSRGSKYFGKLLELDLRFRFLFSATNRSKFRSLELEPVDFGHGVLRFVIHSAGLFESHLLMAKVGLYTAKRVQAPNRPKAWRGWEDAFDIF